jgi:hypothetical protein
MFFRCQLYRVHSQSKIAAFNTCGSTFDYIILQHVFSWKGMVIHPLWFKSNLVGGDWNMFYDFPYIGNNHPNCLIFFGRGRLNHQPVIDSNILIALLLQSDVGRCILPSLMGLDPEIPFCTSTSRRSDSCRPSYRQKSK